MAPNDPADPPAAPPTPAAPPAGALGSPPPGPAPTHGVPPQAPPAAPAAPAAADPATPPTPPAAPAPAAPAPKVPTIADGQKPGEPPPATPADWPEDWKAKLAGDNKAALKRLDRFQSPQDVLKSYLALEQKQSTGELKKALPTNFTAEELAEYRKENGIPDKPEDYDVKVDGMVWGELDKPHLESWKDFAHQNNMTPREVKLGLQWYARQQEAMVDALHQQDQTNFQRGSDTMRAELGKEFQPTLNAAANLYSDAPKVQPLSPGEKPVAMWDAIMASRMPDGRRLGDVPEFLKFTGKIGKDLVPSATYIAPTGSAAKSAEDRLGELNAMQFDKQGPYYFGPQRDALQAEWRSVYEQVEAQKAKGAKAA